MSEEPMLDQQNMPKTTDEKPHRAKPLVQKEIPGLGTVHLRRSVSVGIIRHAYNLIGEVNEKDSPALFANFILAYMLVDPPMSSEDVSELPSDEVTALIGAAVDILGVRSEYDETPVDLPSRERLYYAFDKSMQILLAGISDAAKAALDVDAYLGDMARAALDVYAYLSDATKATLDVYADFSGVISDMTSAFFDVMRGPLSRLLSEYRMRHIFIRCPACGYEFAISDPDLGREDLFEYYQQQRGKECWVQCDKLLQGLAEEFQLVAGNTQQPPCTHRFNLHEGLVEYKAEAPLVWFSRGPYTLVDEGVVDLKIGQAVQLDLNVSFFQIDYVEIIPRKSPDVTVRAHWRRVGRQRNQFEILTSAERKEDIGKSIKLSWRAVGIREFPKDAAVELWKRYLISSASKLMYEFDSRMSILESWMAFELFLDEFIKARWVEPHLEGNLRYLGRVTAPSTTTTVRLVLHEALGVRFVESEVWQDWEYTRAFRNQVAHGGRLQDTEYGHGSNKKKIGKRFKDTREIAKFCYSSVVRAVYFIRYWEANSAIAQQANPGNADADT